MSELIHAEGREGWGDGKTQCFYYHLELGMCENNRCYYYPAPVKGSVCEGYINCPIFKLIQAEYAEDRKALCAKKE